MKKYADKIGAEYRFDHNKIIAGKKVNVPIYYEPANPLVDDSFDEFQKNSNSLKTDNFNALQVWKKNLDLLEKTNLSTMNLSEINIISHKLSSALYLMLLNTT